MALSDQLFYVYSSDLDVSVQVKVGALEGKLPKPTYDDLIKNPSLQHCISLQQDDKERLQQDLFLTCQVYSDGRKLGLPIDTSYKAFSSRWNWNEWLTLPIKYNELAEDTQIAFTIWDLHDGTDQHIIGGTTVEVFSKRRVFRKGIYDLKVWPFQEADGTFPTKTPGKVKKRPETQRSAGLRAGATDDGSMNGDSEMRRLAKLTKKHRTGLMEKVDWLDRLTFREIEVINEAEKRFTNNPFLMVEFPRVHFNNQEYLIVYFERNGDDVIYFRPNPAIVRCPDPEMGLENLIEAKHHVLTRSQRSGLADRELKPNAAARDQLERVIQAPSSFDLTNEQRDLIWKFRFYLSSNKKALTKFLQSVQWENETEARQATELLKEWTPMDVEDALELLSPQYTHKSVRSYAVSRLRDTPVDDLMLYLLQLVQALKYENFDEIETGTDASFVQDFSGLSLEGSVKERMSSDSNVWEPGTDDSLQHHASTTTTPRESTETMEESRVGDSFGSDAGDLATFLISSACKNATLANYLFWYLKVECESSSLDIQQSSPTNPSSPAYQKEVLERTKTRQMYVAVMKRLSRALLKGGTEARRRRAQLMSQQSFVERLVLTMKAVAKESGNRRKKIEFLQAQLSSQDGTVNFSQLDSLPLPLDPSIKIQSVVAERASLFNSALMPCKLTFRMTDGRDFLTIFKHGDDLRQDQLIIQMICLMDKLLRSENLDLKLTPYKVLATSLADGFVQFVDSHPIRDVIAEWNSIHEFFRFYRPSAKGPYGIEVDVMENYVRSSAGYSVICYLLGIGDRHLHNLLLCKNGKLFHVDFGYILGRDPKPMPPPMKLTREMIDGMGGLNSAQWQEFRRLCYTAFLHLRRHANLILNLFGLMVNASIPDIALEPDKAVKKVELRFHLNLSDEEAVMLMQRLIDASISAKMAVLADWAHDWAQAFR